MKEEYLHYVFKKKMLGNVFRTTNGEELIVLDFGEHNSNAGPDFLDAKIRHNGQVWAGPIEFHVNASDWYLHKHQFDRTYNNVIAHFVYHYDTEITIHNFEIPAVELKQLIKLTHYNRYKQLVQSTNQILCKDQLPDLDEKIIHDQFEVSLRERLWKKSLAIVQDIESYKGDRDKAFVLAVARAFGGQVNGAPLHTLAERVELKWFAKLNYDAFKIEALVLGIAGLLNGKQEDQYVIKLQDEFYYQKQLFNMQEMTAQNWKYSRMRPYNFPDLRLAQFAAWLNARPSTNAFLQNDWSVHKWRIAFNVELNVFWERHFRLHNLAKNQVTTTLTDRFVDLILINAVVPFIYAVGLWEGNDDYTQRAIDVLKKIKPEQNIIIKEWRSAGVKATSAFETQSILELKKQGCNRKKCLFCALGKSILKR